MERVAVIDIGTVSARLAVADVEQGQVQRLIKQSIICDLGEGLTRTGQLTQAAIERVCSCVQSYLIMAKQAGALVCACTLSAAARDAQNSEELLERLRSLGLAPEIIDGSLEAQLTFLGVAQDFIGQKIAVADNGGGSTELVLGSLENGSLKLDFVRSLQLGCRRITEQFLERHDPPLAQELADARSYTRTFFFDELKGHQADFCAADHLVVTGGTVTTLVALKLALEPYDSSRVHLHKLQLAEIEELIQRLAACTLEERQALTGIQDKRAAVILGGAVVVAELLRVLDKDCLTVSERDLLFGLTLCTAAVCEGRVPPFGWRPQGSLLSNIS